MAIRPMRMRTTREEIKDFESTIKKAKLQNKISNSSTLKLAKYIIMALTASGFMIIVVNQLFKRFTRVNTEDE
jgi:hypothetical protein